MKHVAPYGSWKSPISADLVVKDAKRISEPQFDGETIYWIERRPDEKGRNVVVQRRPDGAVKDILPSPFNARSRVHEYGGGAYAVSGGTLYFTNYEDQRIYRLEPGADMPIPITPEDNTRYADLRISPSLEHLICVSEKHTGKSGEPANFIASVSLDGTGAPETLDSERDFYSSPRISPDGRFLAWLQWDHPNMPWDGCELMLAELDGSGRPTYSGPIAGGKTESIFQPSWGEDDALYFISDRSDWWNLYRYTEAEGTEALHSMEADFGLPNWVFGMSTYALVEGGLFCVYSEEGLWKAAFLDTEGTLKPLDLPYVSFSGVRGKSREVLFAGGLPDAPTKLVLLNLDNLSETTLARTSDFVPDPGYISAPRSISFPSFAGRTAHAFSYPPANRDFDAPPEELPPLVLMSHGGPTGATAASLDLRKQYWTSRGFAVLDVNYGGSTGFGRKYRELLRGNWGVVDVEDCVSGAKYLAETSSSDPERLVITGGSAGGYTTLCALAFAEVFKAGASYYGVSDLEALAKETHKFEAHYLDGLIGPYPERKDLYEARSPIHHAEHMGCPVIFFQGLEDKIVPPNQTEKMAQILREKGIPVALIEFESEQHGFRQAKNIRKALESELYFYTRIFGIEPADSLEPVPIDNLN